MSKFIGHWYKSTSSGVIFKVLRKHQMPGLYCIEVVHEDGRCVVLGMYLNTESKSYFRIDAAKARAWKKLVTSSKSIISQKFNEL